MNDIPETFIGLMVTDAFLSGVIVGVAITVLIMPFWRLRLRGKILVLCAIISIACLVYFNAGVIRSGLINLLPESAEETILKKLKRPH